jgi:hypothetical protein
MKLRERVIFAFLFVLVLASTGCAFLAGTAAGGAGGYILRDQGFRVQSPIKKN